MSDLETIQAGANKVLERFEDITLNKFVTLLPSKGSMEKPVEILSETLSTAKEFCNEESRAESIRENVINELLELNHPSTSFDDASTINNFIDTQLDTSLPNDEDLEKIKHLNVTDEEKEQRLALESPLMPQTQNDVTESLTNKPFLETIINSLTCVENDYAALFALCLLYALANNQVTKRIDLLT